MSRAIKRICFIIISQFIRDISADIRYTLTYYIKAYRPLGEMTRLEIFTMWKDDSDLEKPKLKKRKVKGYLQYPDGKRRLFEPSYFELPRVKLEIRKAFEKRDFDAKAMIIRGKLEKMLEEMKTEVDIENKKVNAMVEWYIKNPDSINMIGHKVRGKWKLKPEAKLMHGLTDIEMVNFQKILDEKMKDKEMV